MLNLAQIKRVRTTGRRLAAVLALGLFTASAARALPAFPGAEGFGSTTSGGRGGTVYHVTTTNDSGAGSLRTGVSVANRTIVFDVSGTINLASALTISKNNLTIAGQTAPGDGICLKGWLTSVQNVRDVVIRYIRCRPGDAACPTFQDDAFHFVNATNCIADHLSATWSIDECLSCTWSTNVTAQWCIIGESLKNSCHVKGAHGYGSLIRYANGGVTYHHNLYLDNDSRNPRPGDNVHLDFVNNVVYNWGGTAGYNAEDTDDNTNVLTSFWFTNVLNYASNYFIAGPSTSGHLTVAFDSGTTNSLQCQIYQSGNFIDSNKNGSLDGTDTGWSMFGSPYTQLASRFTAPLVNTDSPKIACERVLAFVGASSARDTADVRLINDVRNQTGAIIDSETQVGGWPTLNSAVASPDTDQDGIPDYWELAAGWNSSVANNNHTNADGYTDLEWYLNWLAAPHVLCNRNSYVDVNLRSVLNVTNAFTFGGTTASNGTVALLGDGFTARFVTPVNSNGWASFSFNATNPATGVGFGPVTVNVLILTINGLNNPPTLAAISNRTVLAGATASFTNSASDPDLPAQTLGYSLLNQPVGASVNSSNGIFNWRPSIAQSGTSNYMSVVVTDSGSPSMSATQSFAVLVTTPAGPQISAPTLTGGVFGLTISGSSGPDYIVQASTNLFLWNSLFTNPSPVLPFNWTDSGASNFNRRFYRIQLGP